MANKDDKVVSLMGMKHNKASRAAKTGKKSDKMDEGPLYCSFCNRPNTEVVKMVKGPGVNICAECTMISLQYLLLEDKLPSREAQRILDSFWDRLN
ncbi:MAG: hypothetical protein BHW64_00320 [Candidatus Melainabacteria bacterium LEY3_CP_29_8]|nr:MAG: hypothetical protein BHW64_00320 [Candidatus Melainabacteria bacterium LEY3_CP_29_8]